MKMQRSVVQVLVIEAGQAQRLAAGEGVITVVEGTVWLTGQDGKDQVLPPGSQRALRDAQHTVVEPFDAAGRVVLRWQPVQAPARGFRWRGLPRAAWDALARNAASMASRTQGAMRAGDSMASSGALK